MDLTQTNQLLESIVQKVDIMTPWVQRADCLAIISIGILSALCVLIIVQTAALFRR